MTEAPKALFILRSIDKERYWNATPVKSDQPFRMEAIFTSRAEAEAAHADWEKSAASKGDPGPLLDIGSFEQLVRLSDFEAGVFRDYLIDHDIPDPETFVPTRRVADLMGLMDWLMELSPMKLAALYAALHRFRFYELIEVPFVFGEYGQEQWEEWERKLPPETPLDEEDFGWKEVEGGFEATPDGMSPPGWYEAQMAWGQNAAMPNATPPPATPAPGWDQDIPWDGTPPGPGDDDSIPF